MLSIKLRLVDNIEKNVNPGLCLGEAHSLWGKVSFKQEKVLRNEKTIQGNT